ncbi:MAG: hypothetical protein J6P44_03995 [Bacteroidales bacterium]|nr:hypothetical protein [Bacteroidales bacterium]
MDEVGKSSVARDEMGILQLMYEGRVEVLQAGTRVKVIESSWTSMRVRTQQGHALWVTASHVRK